jgi:hypothetical protein
MARRENRRKTYPNRVSSEQPLILKLCVLSYANSCEQKAILYRCGEYYGTGGIACCILSGGMDGEDGS